MVIEEDYASDNNDDDLLEPTFDVSPQTLLRRFQKETIKNKAPRQLFCVCRLDGISDLRKDIMGGYKNPSIDLKAVPRVRFEDEDGVGSGLVREFLMSAMAIVDEGIPTNNKPLIFLEGEKDHRLPIHDRSLRITGAFKAIGWMIGHCALHGGIGPYGLSPAVVHYWTKGKQENIPLPVTMEDIPDLDLRDLISQVKVQPICMRVMLYPRVGECKS